jgi:carbon-monoxide dehydrogenase iron sulfur subunit
MLRILLYAPIFVVEDMTASVLSKRVSFVQGIPPYNNCTGCRTCELICSLVHEKTCNPRYGRIHVVRNERSNRAIVCNQCKKPLCASRCATDAIAYDEKKGVVVIDEEKCVGCGTCVEGCPSRAIKIHPLTGKAVKCDLCQGYYSSPACVEFCAPKVLRFADTSTRIKVNRKSNDTLQRGQT